MEPSDSCLILFTSIFNGKTLVIKMMKVPWWLLGRHLFPEHNSATFKNILMVLGRTIEHVNAEFHKQK